MAILANEYTDIRNVRHEVKHFIRTAESKATREKGLSIGENLSMEEKHSMTKELSMEEGLSREQILQELFQIFSKPRKHASA